MSTTRKFSICVSTTKPSSALTPNGGGGSLTVIDPQTGAILSSLRSSADLSGNTSLGISSFSSFPSSFASYDNKHLLMAYGANPSKNVDTHAMLVALRDPPLPPILLWKCRLPEAKLPAGLNVSPCGKYVVGGGESGSCYIWGTHGGALLKTFRAHYRACTCIMWTRCGRYIITGGADGMVHSFLLMDLVDTVTRHSKRSVTPVLTWSNHHFPVTCVINLDGERLAASSEEGRVVIMESFCKQEIVATIKFPNGICSLTYNDSRLYAGSTSGTIFSVDLDAYAMHQTEKQGAVLTKRQRQQNQCTIMDRVFAKNAENDDGDMTRKYQTDWIGHEHAVTAITIDGREPNERMISGDAAGTIRIWDVASRVCVNVLQPWAPTSNVSIKGNASQTSQSHPISSISIVPQPSTAGAGGMFAASNNTKTISGLSNLITPLQKYMKDESDHDASMVSVPFLGMDSSDANLDYWLAKPASRKRKKRDAAKETAPSNPLDAKATILRLERALAEKQEEVKRWEKVNNKLMAKLKPKK